MAPTKYSRNLRKKKKSYQRPDENVSIAKFFQKIPFSFTCATFTMAIHCFGCIFSTLVYFVSSTVTIWILNTRNQTFRHFFGSVFKKNNLHENYLRPDESVSNCLIHSENTFFIHLCYIHDGYPLLWMRFSALVPLFRI